MEWLVAYGGTRADMMVMDAKGNYCLDDYTQLNGCAGRLGPDAPDENQSPVVWHCDYSPTPGWRGSREDECVANTWIRGCTPEFVDVSYRGEIVVCCPELEVAGARNRGAFNGRGTTNMNCLKLGPEYSFGGVTGNPSRTQGNTARMGSTDGTTEIGGGSLTIFHNSPTLGKRGQQLFFSEVPMVIRKDGEVVGNKYRYDTTYKIDRKGRQQKLLPTVIVLNGKNIEHLQNGPLFELSERLYDWLLPGKVAIQGGAIETFSRDVISREASEQGFNLIPHVTTWVRVVVLADGLRTAFFRWKGSSKGSVHVDDYQKASKSLWTQLAAAINDHYAEERRKVTAKYETATTTIARKLLERMPRQLETSWNPRWAGQDDADLQMQAEFREVDAMLKRASFVAVTLHNYIYSWMDRHWMGTQTSPVSHPGYQVSRMPSPLCSQRLDSPHSVCVGETAVAGVRRGRELRNEPERATRNRETSSSSSAATAETSRHASDRFNQIHSRCMTLPQLVLCRVEDDRGEERTRESGAAKDKQQGVFATWIGGNSPDVRRAVPWLRYLIGKPKSVMMAVIDGDDPDHSVHWYRFEPGTMTALHRWSERRSIEGTALLNSRSFLE